MQIIKDLIPFQYETVGSSRLRKFLSLALIVGLLQSFSWTLQIIEAPKSDAAYQTGSASFNSEGQYLSVPNNSDFAVGTGDFTVEWWQYMTQAPTPGYFYNWQRPWVINSPTNYQFGLSFEPYGASPYVYFWMGGSTLVGNLTNFSLNYQNQWKHFAITRTSGIVRIFINGTQLGTDITKTYNFTDTTTPLAIGSIPDNVQTTFSGQITNFHFVKGTSLYSSYFTTPTKPISPVTNSKVLMLNANSSSLLTDSSGLNKTVTSNGNVTYSSSAPSWAVDAVTPTLSSATLASNGLSIALNFSETISVLTAVPSNFLVQVNGSETRTITSISLSGSTATLNLSTAVTANTDLTFTYTDPTAGDDTNALQDDYGNDVATISNYRITNNLNSLIDSALNLNGSNQYASTPDNSALDITGNFTGEAWAYPTSATAVGTVFGKWGAYMLQARNGNWYYWLQGTSGWTGINTGIAVTQDQWSHVAITRAASTNEVKFYLNGRLVYVGTADTVGTGNINNSNGPLVIGSHNTDSDYFLGSIDEVKIWNVVRSESDIQSDLKTYGGALSSGLVAYYDFNELIATKIFNRSTGGSTDLNLTITASPTISSTRIFETSTVQAYSILQFKRSYLVASGGWTSPSNVNSIRYLVIGGGGGGGGGYNGGGGGAGGYRESNTAILPNTVYNIEVGVGGIGALGKYSNTSGADSAIRRNSQQTDSITASGGGKGGTEQQTSGGPNAQTTPDGSPSNGGSGGGGTHGATFSGTAGGAGNKGAYSPSEGNVGGTGASGGTDTTYYLAGGGGGGAGGAGGNADSFMNGNPGNGGTGKTSYITGSPLNLAGGGAGAGRFRVNSLTDVIKHGSSSSFGGGSGSCTTSCTTDTGTAGLVNTGSGGGGGAAVYGTALGGAGGSGFIVIRFITNQPTIITQPLSDTSTVGAVETFTVATSTAPTPLNKSIKWQFTADTTTVTEANITGWADVSTGTGYTTDTFTTTTLTKAMNKYRYRAIVTFSDTATISSVETSTIATLTINDAITFSVDSSTITRKYGDTQTVRPINYSGGTTSNGSAGTSTSHTVTVPYGPLANGKIYVDTKTSTAYFKVDTGTVVGTYYETVTVTDYYGNNASYVQKVVVNPADTLTVQADTLTAITYGATPTLTYTASGLVNNDSIATINYGNISCANGGTCSIGDIGPGGGVVFYEITNSSDSQTAVAGITGGGIYLEAAPVGWANGISVQPGETTGTAYLDPILNWCNNTNSNTGATQIGMGQGGINTSYISSNCSSGAGRIAADLTLNGKSDWYLPSKNELAEMANQYNLIGLNYGINNCWSKTCYWSSTESAASSAWVYTFTSAPLYPGNNGKGLTSNAKILTRPIRAFSPLKIGTETVTAGAPSAAGTYLLKPTSITLANNVDTSNYVSVVYQSSKFTINRATQSPKLGMQPAKNSYDTGTATIPLTYYGGAGSGYVFYLLGSGGAAGCSITGNALSITSEGTCNVVAYKQASANYLYDSATAVSIVFTKFASYQPVQVQLYPNMIPLNGANALETTTVTSSLLTITGITNSGGGAYTVTGTGFTNVSIVRIGGTDLVLNTNYTVPTTTSISITNASGLMGPLFISLSDGQQAVRFAFPD